MEKKLTTACAKPKAKPSMGCAIGASLTTTTLQFLLDLNSAMHTKWVEEMLNAVKWMVLQPVNRRISFADMLLIGLSWRHRIIKNNVSLSRFLALTDGRWKIAAEKCVCIWCVLCSMEELLHSHSAEEEVAALLYLETLQDNACVPCHCIRCMYKVSCS